MEKEIWKDITGYEGLYQVSNLGRVRSLDRTINDKNGKKRFFTGKISKPKMDKHGYLSVALHKKGIQKHMLVHRLVAKEFILNPLNLPQVNHKDGIKTNNNASNLDWVAPQENMQHAVNFNLIKKGAKHPLAKLSQNQVNEIRQLYSTGCISMCALAKKFRLNRVKVLKIIHNLAYIDENYIPSQKNFNQKLTFEQAEEIRKLYSTEKFSMRALAEKYGVDCKVIFCIIHNKTYKSE